VNGRRSRALGRGKVLRYVFRRPGIRYVRLSVRNRSGQRSSTTKRIAVSAATSPVTTQSPAADLSLQQVDGGPNYYGEFSGALPSDPSYFPIAVWGAYDHTQANRDKDAAVGLNTYLWAADSHFIPEIRADGRFRVIQDESLRATAGSETAGWLLADEIDMTEGPAACNGSLQQIKNGLPADGRLRYTNYGKGVLLWETDAEAGCFVNAQDVTSSDLYWHTDPNQIDMFGEPWLPEGERQMTASEVQRSSNYGYQVDRMRALDAREGGRRPIWNFVEVGWPWGEAATMADYIQPAEIRGAVWHSLIAGARGIIYFQHSFNGPCHNHHTLRMTDPCAAPVIAEVTRINAQIKQLAPVLNAPTVTSGHSASPSIRTMVKWQGGNLYVFAGSRSNVSSTGTVSIPCVGDATAARLGESGSVPVSGGSFSDQFADGNSIHIYRIDGGSTCGLPARSEQSAPGGGGANEQPGTGGRTTKVGRLPKRVSLRSGRLFVPVTCAAVCTVRSRLTTRGASRRVRLAATRRRFGAGRHRVVLRLSKRSRRYVARQRKPLPMRLSTVIVKPGGGARRTQHLVLR
jgi:hypothetical protein